MSPTTPGGAFHCFSSQHGQNVYVQVKKQMKSIGRGQLTVLQKGALFVLCSSYVHADH